MGGEEGAARLMARLETELEFGALVLRSFPKSHEACVIAGAPHE